MQEEEGRSPVLPPELWGYTLQFIPIVTACEFRLVSKEWKQVIDQESFWESRVKQDFGDSCVIDHAFLTWKERYKEMAGWKWVTTETVKSPEEESKIQSLEFTNRDRTVRDPATSYGMKPTMSKQSITIHARPQGRQERQYHFLEYHLDQCNQYSGYGLADGTFLTHSYYNKKNSGTGWYVLGDIWTNHDTGGRALAFMSDERLKNAKPVAGDDIGILLDVTEKRLLFFLNREPVYKWVDIQWVWTDMEIKGEDHRQLHAAVMLDREIKVTLHYRYVIPPAVLEKAKNVEAP